MGEFRDMKVVSLILVGGCAFAQGLADPPPILEIVQKPGYAAAAARPYAEAHAAVNVVGLSAVTGLPETWFLEMHRNYTSLEDLDTAMSAAGAPRAAGAGEAGQDDILAPARTLIATYSPEWSYRPEQASRLFPQARYFHVTVYRLRNASESTFSKLIALRRATLESRNADRPDIAYEVVSGAPAGTYIIVAPVVSLRAMDNGLPNAPAYAQGLADERAKFLDTTPASDISRESLLFRVDPRLSYVSDDFAAPNRDFWRGK
jgi:hypothetical protein